MTQSSPFGHDEVMVLGALGFCFCLVGVLGMLGVAVWLIRGRATQQPTRPMTAIPVNPVAAPAQPATQPHADLQLSVLAVAIDASIRGELENRLAVVSALPDHTSSRVELVRVVIQSLLEHEARWFAFGYGEKFSPTLQAAQDSYNTAIGDFQGRAGRAGDSGALTVLTLIMSNRGRRLGLARLETRAEVRRIFEDRLQLDAGSLLGAEVAWAPLRGGFSALTLKERFPELHELRSDAPGV